MIALNYFKTTSAAPSLNNFFLVGSTAGSKLWLSGIFRLAALCGDLMSGRR